MKRKKEEIDVYIEQVAAKEKEGEYDTRDMCGQKFKDWTRVFGDIFPLFQARQPYARGNPLRHPP